MKLMRILGIETSCDETAASLLEIKAGRFRILSSLVASQIKIHAKTGGVVPEVAAREHLTKLLPLIEKSLTINHFLIKPDIIAVTSGPGLITSLMVGAETAKTLSYLWRKPLIAVNHLEAHLYSNWLGDYKDSNKIQAFPKIKFPALCLIVSGGHTELVLIKNYGQYKSIGQTQDDAAGEAFDKVAKLLKLGYPGGPAISSLAKKGAKDIFDLPRPMIRSGNFDFSFSGLKTAVLYLVKGHGRLSKQEKADLAASFQQAVIDVLIAKTLKAAKKYKVKSVMLSGGVAANQELRRQFKAAAKKQSHEVKFYLAATKFCTDNATMVALAGYFHSLKKDFTHWSKVKVDPNWELTPPTFPSL